MKVHLDFNSAGEWYNIQCTWELQCSSRLLSFALLNCSSPKPPPRLVFDHLTLSGKEIGTLSPRLRAPDLRTVPLEVAAIEPRRALITPQHVADGHGCGQERRKVGPLALARGARARVLELAVVHVVEARVVVVPLAPAERVDDLGHGGALEDDARIVAPGATEPVGARGYGIAVEGGDGAVVEDIPRVVVLLTTVGYYISLWSAY